MLQGVGGGSNTGTIIIGDDIGTSWLGVCDFGFGVQGECCREARPQHGRTVLRDMLLAPAGAWPSNKIQRPPNRPRAPDHPKPYSSF